MRSDPLKVRQILLNLLSNAAKFTENGQIKLSIHRTTNASNAVANHQDRGQRQPAR